ncbi:MAG: c-type cytochrome, partial [Ginsengibacter sp.]
DLPNGRISILEDLDGDGIADHSKIFLDSLVLPRAIAHVYGGLLYAVPPNLWFTEINNDKPGKKTLVDSLYSSGGNVEAQPNGLMMNIDNWIYSANSNFRYQFKDGKWKKEETSFRGQWGISKDNFGRLYYNSNEVQLIGDYVMPNCLIQNPYLKPKEAINKILTDDQRVYPLHPTTVNRGYAKGILNSDSLLVKFTAACGPLIYQGDQFPGDYNQNAFVCEPEANLIKRDILTFDSITTSAHQAWSDREFIASSDESFRPVNLFNGPDGAMYVVDMHRGIMQHRAYATPYYRQEIAAKKLDTLLNQGRILRVKYKNKKLGKIPNLNNASDVDLVSFLKSRNVWISDRAQQLLIFKQQKSVIPELEKMAQDEKNVVSAIHALHTLDGLNSLSFQFLKKIANLKNPMLSPHALLLLRNYNTNENVVQMAELANNLLVRNSSVINLYLAISLGPWIQVSDKTFLPILEKISQACPGNAIYQEAVASSLKNQEENFQVLIKKQNTNKSNETLNRILEETIKNKKAKQMNSIFVEYLVPVDERSNGLILFRNTCATCHGGDGGGMENIAPPLKGSQYVEGPTDRLAMIILNGLEGSVHINGKLYHFNGSMPNFGNNFTDKEIADIIEYLHNSFVPGQTKAVSAEKIKDLRSKNLGTLTENKLLEITGSDKETKGE